MAHIMPLGISDFRKVREDHSFYVDKSRLISDILRDRSEVILLPRPRRFGKTLNLTMLRDFFDDRADNQLLFAGLKVCDDPETMAFLGNYPTVFLTFKDLKPTSWASCQRKLILLISEMFKDLRQRFLAADLYEDERALVQSFIEAKADLELCQNSLGFLTKLLHRLTGKRVVLLIDEYDSPIHAGYQNGYRNEVVGFMRDFLSAGLKDNSSLRKGVLTGILRVAKDSIFSGLNNLSVYTILDNPYASYFGFTTDEVQNILVEAGMSSRESEVQRWYNGYRFGATTLYNPWSILSIFKDPRAPFTAHWINTANNAMIRDLVVEERAISLAKLTTLLAGDALECLVDPFVALNDLRPESVWGLLLLSGYLTLADVQPDEPMHYALRIPNLEVHTFFASTVSHWLGQEAHTGDLMASLLAEDMPRFAALLAETVVQVLSYHDTGGNDSERVYHAFLAGLLVKLSQSHHILSNRESGFGRFDLALLPKNTKATGFLFELKRSEPRDVAHQAQAALAQIGQKDYTAALRERGISRIRHIGLAFDGKRVALATVLQDEDRPGITENVISTGPSTPSSRSTVSANINEPRHRAAFYNDEARYLLEQGRAAEALTVLDLGETNGAADDQSRDLRSQVLLRLGRGADASALRREQTF